MNDGGPAFPTPGVTVHDDGTGRAGGCLSVRDWFAGQALNGWLASFPDDRVLDVKTMNVINRMCYHMADAMLAERDKDAE